MIGEKVLKFLNSYVSLEENNEICVALSGGADSMCLLYALLFLRKKGKINVDIKALHLNHLIRGKEADRDENFVREVCSRLDVELISEQIDVPKIAQAEKLSIELAARKARYDFFERSTNGFVATAHNANDNLETVIFNLARGTSLKGLCGIPPIRDNFIRPLLYCTREEIENYCARNGIEFVTDSTNLSDEYTRNRIRHNILPLLREINSNVEYNTAKMCDALRQDFSFIESCAQEYLLENLENGCLRLDGFVSLAPSVAKLVLSKSVFAFNKSCELKAVHFDSLIGIIKSGGSTNLPDETVAFSDKRFLRFSRNSEKKSVDFSVRVTKKVNNFIENEKINNLFLNNLIDCDKICGELLLRTRLQGDKMRPLKRGITKTLKQLYNEYKIPIAEREKLPVLADDKGVVYIHKIGVAERCAIDSKTKNLYQIEVETIGEV